MQSYKLYTRKDGRVGLMLYIHSVQRSQAFETLSHDGDGKARGYLCSIKQFDFTVALCAAKHVFSNSVACFVN